eukprot:359132-Chlamydomonas_euryale.AAC.7
MRLLEQLRLRLTRPPPLLLLVLLAVAATVLPRDAFALSEAGQDVTIAARQAAEDGRAEEPRSLPLPHFTLAELQESTGYRRRPPAYGGRAHGSVAGAGRTSCAAHQPEGANGYAQRVKSGSA